MTALVSVLVRASELCHVDSDGGTGRVAAEFGLPTPQAELILRRAGETSGTVLFQGAERSAEQVAARARNVGLRVQLVDAGRVEDRARIEPVNLPRRRGRH